MGTMVVIQDFRARRRLQGEQRWLIRDNYYYELDPLVDAVWVACTQPRTVAQIAHVLEARGLAGPERALAIARMTIEHFASEGFVRLEPRDAT